MSNQPRQPATGSAGGGTAGSLAARPAALGVQPSGRLRRSLGDSRLADYLFVLPAVIFILATILYPIIYTVDLSLHDVTIRNFLAGNAPFVGLDNYRAALADPALQRAFSVSLLYTSGSLALTFIFGFAFAVLFNRVFPGAGPLRALLMLAWILPSVVSGNIWRWMLDGSNGVVNYALQRLGVIDRQIFWLTESETALSGVILATAWTTIPFAMVLLLAGLQGIPVTLYEAAALDGARALRRFFDITVPMMRPVILTVLLLNFIYTFKTFDTIYIMTRGGPGDATTVLPIYAYTVGFSFFRLGDGAVATTLLLIIPPKLVPWPPDFGPYQKAVLDNPDVVQGVINSTIIAIGTTIVTLLLAAPAGYGLARLRLRFTVAIAFMLLISQMLPSINLALPLFVIFARVGLVDSYPALIIANATATVPFAIIILRPFFLTVPGEVVEASRVDGSTRFGAFWRVALPLAGPGLITVAAVTFLTAWGEFVFGLTLATSEEMQPITVVLSGFITQFGTRWNELMAVSTVVAIPIVVFFVLLQRYIVGGMTAGAMKE